MSYVARARHVALACVLASGAAFACNAIVGVADVKLKKATKDGGIEPGDDDEGPVDANEPIDSAATQRPNILTVVLGETHSCGRKPDGTVKCWGDDKEGQTGSLGATADAGVITSAVPVKGITDARDIAAGRRHACVAHTTGKVSCWGYNLDGQLGNGNSGDRASEPALVKNIDNAFRIAAGGSFSCAVRGTGSVACWGNNGSGQLGTGDTSPSLLPVVVDGLGGVTSISAGQAHVCVVKGDGSVLCWGDGSNGQLGNGNTQSSGKPVVVASLPKAVAVSAGERSTCALTEIGSVACWGANEVGQLGSGAANANANPSPITVADVEGAVAIATGRNHTCAVKRTGEAVCWGEGAQGQLGDDVQRDAGTAQARAVTVARLKNAFRVGAGFRHSCATTSDDKILCWGASERGQLGNQTTADTRAPVLVVGF